LTAYDQLDAIYVLLQRRKIRCAAKTVAAMAPELTQHVLQQLYEAGRCFLLSRYASISDWV
jgi:N-acyl-L-homoserine lactone synthetase